MARQEGIKKKTGASATILYAATNENDAAVNAAKDADVAVVVVGNHPICGSSQEQSTAIADVLFGDLTPEGKLNRTWPKSLSHTGAADE